MSGSWNYMLPSFEQNTITHTAFQGHEVAFQVYLSVTTSDGWESGFGPIEMLVSSVANSNYAIPGTSRASGVASRSAWSTHTIECSGTLCLTFLFSMLY